MSLSFLILCTLSQMADAAAVPSEAIPVSTTETSPLPSTTITTTSGLSIGAKTGLVVGISIGCAILITIAFLVWRHRSLHSHPPSYLSSLYSKSTYPLTQHSTPNLSTSPISRPEKNRDSPTSRWEVSLSALETPKEVVTQASKLKESRRGDGGYGVPEIVVQEFEEESNDRGYWARGNWGRGRREEGGGE
ncbi:hypothetical protein B7494_g2118 [Chlorociboria aeruginascens]|nr:hypothetical protein B7494_g2118 [Chlorociboria aeruginascens]